VQIPIASTAIEQCAGNLDSFINFLCGLNIINTPLLQASTGMLLKLFTHLANYLLACGLTNEFYLQSVLRVKISDIYSSFPIAALAGMLQSAV
jgi:hypothetical protein